MSLGIPGIGPVKEKILTDAGYDTLEKLKEAEFFEILRLPLFGYKSTYNMFLFLEKEFSPEFYSTDLVNLSKQNIYVKLMIDGLTSRPFSAVLFTICCFFSFN